MRSYNIIEKILPLKALILDVDGVLTPGGIWRTDKGDQFKAFDVKDGLALSALKEMGIILAIITGKSSELVLERARELRIADVYQNAPIKMPSLNDLAKKRSLKFEEMGFIGDDIIDIEAMEKCGFSACPSDAVFAVRRIADWVARAPGGMGAVREVCEIIIAAKTAHFPPDRSLIEMINNKFSA